MDTSILDIFEILENNSNLVQSVSAVLTVFVSLFTLIIAVRALNTYKSQILFELEIESKALALRTFEIYLKLNKHEFYDHLLKGDFLEKYNNGIHFYGEEFIDKHNQDLLRHYEIEQTYEGIEIEMKEINKIVYKVISTFHPGRKYKRIYKYYIRFFTFYQLYKLNNTNLAALIIKRFNEQNENIIIELNHEIEHLSIYFLFTNCKMRNDELQTLMEEATNIE